MDLQAFAAALEAVRLPRPEAWQPWIVRLGPDQGAELDALCAAHGLTQVDTYERQIEELASVRHPGPHREADRRRFRESRGNVAGSASSASNGSPSHCAGTWVLLPWTARIVHLLDRDDYFDVITNRNHDKITRSEQLALRARTVGVVGLSVGGEAAVTIAQEHLCARIRLADFDDLDLSNLNRINAGCDELGHAKTRIVARRIAAIDPYLEVEIFEDGVTEDNAAAFIDGLDLLVEECDGLAMKYRLRELARERRINLVYAADERGLLSVEPYAHAPDLQPFHGRLEGPQPAREAYPSTGAFMRALTEWLGGWDAIDARSRDSVERIGKDLCGYPQLASEPRYAAGQIGHVARRLLLGEQLAPSLEYHDLSQRVG